MPTSENTAAQGPKAAIAATPGARAGLLYGMGAYAWWGLVAAYFKLLSHVPAEVVLGHRIVWSVLLLAAILTVRRQWADFGVIARTARAWPWLAASTVLIAVNWLVFIYAVSHGRLIESSLGYFMTPLINVLLGIAFLGERPRPVQWVGVGLGAAGMAYLAAAEGGLSWIALTLAVSFGLYGLIRKQAPAGPLVGLMFETALLAPAAAVYLALFHSQPSAGMVNTPRTLGLLSLSGIVTAVPLLWFAAAARRLPMVTLGFLQYISPSLQFLTAVIAFGEPFGRERAIAFGLIWVALAALVVDSAHRMRAQRRTSTEV